MGLYNWLPYLIGFVLRGESALLMWFVHFVNEPQEWKWICIIVVLISNLSFILYFFAGYFSENYLHLREKIYKFTHNLNRTLLTSPKPIVIIFMRFLFFIRNPIAVYLGIKKYKPWKFILYNFAGSILWIIVWFALFYWVRMGIGKILQDYSKILYIVYILFLTGWIFTSLKWKKIKNLLFKHE